MQLAAFALAQLLVLTALAATCWAAGGLAARAARGPELPAGLRLGLGFALLAQLMLLLGFLHQLRPGPILAVLVLLHAAAWRWGRPYGIGRIPGGTLSRLAAAALAAPVFVLALYPPLGFDQTLYHLPFSRAFAATGSLPFLGDLRFPVFPQLLEVLQAAIWLLAGEIATQQAGLLALLACLGLLWAWTREKAGEEAGFFAVAMVFGSPCAVYLATCGYLEPVLGLLVLGALYAAEKAERTSAAFWPLAAGFLAGSAAATKYHGLFFLAATPLLMLRLRASSGWTAAKPAIPPKPPGLAATAAPISASSFSRPAQSSTKPEEPEGRSPSEKRISPLSPSAGRGGQGGEGLLIPLLRVNLRALALYGAAAMVAALPSYLRIYGHTGNPLFPFYAEIFGSGPWTEETMLPRGAARWQRVATLLWDLSFRRDAVGWLPPYLPIFLLALPMALYASWRWPDLRRPAILALAFLLISPTHGHYFAAVAAIWALLLATGLDRLLAAFPWRRRALAAAALLLALGGPAYAVYRIHLLGPPPGDAAGRDRLLAAQLPIYPAILYLDREAPAGRVFAAGPVVARLTSYYDGTLLGDVNGVESVDRVGRRARALGSLAAALREIGAGYALIDAQEKEWLALAESDPGLEEVYRDAGAAVFRLHR